MAKYIDVDNAVKEAINACNKICRENGIFLTSIDAVDIAEALDEIPAADVVEVKHSRIKLINRPISAQYAEITKENGEKHYGKVHDRIENNPVGYCGECGRRLDDTFMNFCPNCGAKMDGGRENDGKD